MPSISDWPLYCTAKSMMVVVPPCAAAIVPVRKSSDDFGAAERQFHVRVRIDAAGNDEFAGGVDRLVRFHLEARADHGDAFVFDQNVGACNHRPRSRRGRS